MFQKHNRKTKKKTLWVLIKIKKYLLIYYINGIWCTLRLNDMKNVPTIDCKWFHFFNYIIFGSLFFWYCLLSFKVFYSYFFAFLLVFCSFGFQFEIGQRNRYKNRITDDRQEKTQKHTQLKRKGEKHKRKIQQRKLNRRIENGKSKFFLTKGKKKLNNFPR